MNPAIQPGRDSASNWPQTELRARTPVIAQAPTGDTCCALSSAQMEPWGDPKEASPRLISAAESGRDLGQSRRPDCSVPEHRLTHRPPSSPKFQLTCRDTSLSRLSLSGLATGAVARCPTCSQLCRERGRGGTIPRGRATRSSERGRICARSLTDTPSERVGASLDNCAGVTERGGEIAGKWVGLSSLDAVFSE